jgi:hypothetical protein
MRIAPKIDKRAISWPPSLPGVVSCDIMAQVYQLAQV